MSLWFYIVVAIFFVLLVFPIAFAYISYKRSHDSALYIKRDTVRDPRYFGKSFSALIKKAWNPEYDNKTITLSKKESVLYTKNSELPQNLCDTLVISEKDIFISDSNYTFKKEIYAQNDVCIQNENTLRAVYSNGDLIIGNNTQLLRWADAEGTTAVFDGCNLGLSVSSAVALSVGTSCSFRRLYAPCVYLGVLPENIAKINDKAECELFIHNKTNIKKLVKVGEYITQDMKNEQGYADFSIISDSNFTLTENTAVLGDIQSSNGIHICNNAFVRGSIFADGDIYIDENCRILGSVFTQGNIYIKTGTIIGIKGKTCSVIARKNITFSPKCAVFGYISCEHKGKTDATSKPEAPHNLCFLEWLKVMEKLIIKTTDEYDALIDDSIRENHELKYAALPDGVVTIKDSMFYGCSSLTDVELPKSVSIIGDYAFSGCSLLSSVNLLSLSNLKRIGNHAFDGCKNLKSIIIPSCVQEIGNSAFEGCSSLSSVKFESGSQLVSIGSHAFKDCIKLTRPILPQSAIIKSPDPFTITNQAFTKNVETIYDENHHQRISPEKTKEKNIILKNLLANSVSKKELQPAKPTISYQNSHSARAVIKWSAVATAMAVVLSCALWQKGFFKAINTQLSPASSSYDGLKADKYRLEGLNSDFATSLSKTPISETDDKTIYKDRILNHFFYSSKNIEYTVSTIRALRESIPSDIKFYTMFVPTRIYAEDISSASAKAINRSISELSDLSSQYTDFIDTSSLLYSHKNEYIYYRTDESWTSLGAYYGASQFFKASAINAPDISQYDEYLYSTFYGDIWRTSSLDTSDESYKDANYFYLMPGSLNTELLTARNSDGSFSKYRTPLISKSRGGMNAYVGASFSHAFIDGNSNNGKTLLLIGDEFAKLLSPWMLSSYSSVIMLDPKWFNGGNSSYKELFSEYHITDVLFAEGIGNLGETVINQRLHRFI